MSSVQERSPFGEMLEQRRLERESEKFRKTVIEKLDSIEFRVVKLSEESVKYKEFKSEADKTSNMIAKLLGGVIGLGIALAFLSWKLNA